MIAATPVSAGPPQRIVSLVPNVTEMLFAIGAGPDVVGVSNYDRHPPAVAALPHVGGLLDPDTERIFALKPDLVVVYGGQDSLAARLTTARIAFYVYQHKDLADVSATIRALGALVGRKATADEMAASVERDLRTVAARVAGRPLPTTLLIISRESSSLRNIFASGGYGFLHDLIQVAGGRDALDDITRESVQITTEMILARRPDVIIQLRYGTDARNDLSAWRVLSAVPAVRNKRVYELDGDQFAAGPRVARAAEALAKLLHP